MQVARFESTTTSGNELIVGGGGDGSDDAEISGLLSKLVGEFLDDDSSAPLEF